MRGTVRQEKKVKRKSGKKKREFWSAGEWFLVLLGIDLLAKQYVEETMLEGEEREIPGKKLILRKVYNRGFLLNTLEEHPDIVKAVSLAAGAGFLLYDGYLFTWKGNRLEKLGVILAGAGGASNLADRLFRGRVVDYIGVESRSSFLSRLTANLGDLYLFIGAVIVMVSQKRKRGSVRKSSS